jgi:hypothetical protein
LLKVSVSRASINRKLRAWVQKVTISRRGRTPVPSQLFLALTGLSSRAILLGNSTVANGSSAVPFTLGKKTSVVLTLVFSAPSPASLAYFPRVLAIAPGSGD